MSKKFFYIFLFLFLSLKFIKPACVENQNFCSKCNPLTNLCIKCSLNILSPNEDGGCSESKICTQGENHCENCDSEGKLCNLCEQSFHPDENGGCSYTDNCLFSYNGECLKCKENFILIGEKNSTIKMCKYIFSNDLKNCDEINYINGKCKTCQKGYFLTENDQNCCTTENCLESAFQICKLCKKDYILNKENDECILKSEYDSKLKNCKLTLDGKNCDECDDGYFFTDIEKICVNTNYCSEAKDNLNCKKCIDGYFLSNDKKTCTNEINCDEGDNETGFCNLCLNNFYLDKNDMKCKTNKENNIFKNCAVANDNCIKCINDFYLSENNICTDTNNCNEAENGICTKCKNSFYLGLDNHCSKVEHCIYSNFYGCLECEDNYYYSRDSRQCIYTTNEKFLNCKTVRYFSEKECDSCKTGFYLNLTDKICYDNKNFEYGMTFYKCASTNYYGKICSICENGYYRGTEDDLCSKIKNCATSENENKCTKCDKFACMDLKKGTCENNYEIPEIEENKKYFYCNKTNSEGTECAECRENYELKNGLCYNKVRCEVEKDNECIKCNEISERGNKVCLNKEFGCVETKAVGCLRCDDSLNINKCTECLEGYNLDEDGNCNQEKEN